MVAWNQTIELIFVPCVFLSFPSPPVSFPFFSPLFSSNKNKKWLRACVPLAPRFTGCPCQGIVERWIHIEFTCTFSKYNKWCGHIIGMVEQKYRRLGHSESHRRRWHCRRYTAKRRLSMVWRWDNIARTSFAEIRAQPRKYVIFGLVDVSVLRVQATTVAIVL